MKILRCRDIGYDCDEVFKAYSEDELFEQAAEHGNMQHGVQKVSPEMRLKVTKLIRDEAA